MCSKCGKNPRKSQHKGTHPWCGKCQSAASTDWSRRHPEQTTLRQLRHKLKGYGLTIEQYEAMLTKQGGGCAICGAKRSGKRRLSVDHDHCTGRVRGVLCANCNRAIGLLGDDPTRLQKALAYLLPETN